MGFFSFLQTRDINSGVRSFLSTEGAVLLDVRTPEEYAEGHIEGSKNIPLQSIEKTESVITDISLHTEKREISQDFSRFLIPNLLQVFCTAK